MMALHVGAGGGAPGGRAMVGYSGMLIAPQLSGSPRSSPRPPMLLVHGYG